MPCHGKEQKSKLIDGLFMLITCLGFPMANNLRAKMPEEDLLVVHDIDQDVVKKFVDGSGEKRVEMESDVKALAERCVRPFIFFG